VTRTAKNVSLTDEGGKEMMKKGREDMCNWTKESERKGGRKAHFHFKVTTKG